MHKKLKLKRMEILIAPRQLADLGRYAAREHEHNLSRAARHLIATGLGRVQKGKP